MPLDRQLQKLSFIQAGMSLPGTSKGEASGFVQQLILAIEDAQAQAAKPKPAAQLAQSAWDKLQYDFPV